MKCITTKSCDCLVGEPLQNGFVPEYYMSEDKAIEAFLGYIERYRYNKDDISARYWAIHINKLHVISIAEDYPVNKTG